MVGFLQTSVPTVAQGWDREGGRVDARRSHHEREGPSWGVRLILDSVVANGVDCQS